MGRARPLAEANHFQCNCAVETFLAGAINHALSTATNLLEKFIIAELHVQACRVVLAIAILLERSQSGLEQANTAKSARRIGKNRRPAFCAHALDFIGLGTQPRSSLLCTDRNSLAGYVWSTEMKWRSSSSTSPGTATVWAISWRSSSRYR